MPEINHLSVFFEPLTSKLALFNTKLTRTIGLGILLLFILNEMLFLGFKHTFPNIEASHYVHQQIEAQTHFSVQITPIEIKSWRQFYVPQLTLFAALNNDIFPFLSLSENEINWDMGLFEQHIELSSKIYGGSLLARFKVIPLESGTITLKNVLLQQTTPLHQIPYIKLSGKIENLTTQVNNVAEFAQSSEALPKGFINTTLQNLKIQVQDDLPVPLPVKIPELQFLNVSMIAKYGEIIEIQEIDLLGDLEGKASGTIQVDQGNILNSTANLTIKFKISPELKELLAKQPMLNSLLAVVKCGDLIHAKLSGTLQLWNPPEKLCS